MSVDRHDQRALKAEGRSTVRHGHLDLAMADDAVSKRSGRTYNASSEARQYEPKEKPAERRSARCEKHTGRLLLGLLSSLCSLGPLLTLASVSGVSSGVSESSESLEGLLVVRDLSGSLGLVSGGQGDGVSGDVGSEVVALRRSVSDWSKEYAEQAIEDRRETARSLARPRKAEWNDSQ